jgi:tetratricopeptide (TPR) repeat protein
MASPLTPRQLLVSFLAIWRGMSQKEIAAASGISPKRISQHLTRDTDIRDDAFERLLAAISPPAGAVPIVTACLEALEALERDDRLTPEERTEREEGILAITRLVREALSEAILVSQKGPPPDFPRGFQARLDRERAERLWERLKDTPEGMRAEVVRIAPEFQSWALCERVCAESVTEASRDLKRSAALARLASEIAEQVPGPAGWRDRVQGYATAHVANVLRVAGDLKGAEAHFTTAKRLWHAGVDPAAVLDPGRLLDLEASLRRGQRRFAEALALLDEALAIGRSPARVLVNKGSTLDVMGDYERSIEALLQALPLVESQGDQRLRNMLRCNLGFALCHTGRFAEAAELAAEAQACATEMGDEIIVLRGLWLQGRVAAGLKQYSEALSLLAQARREFALREMDYDVALALLEEAALLLDEGRSEEVKLLAEELASVFRSKGVHREALAALRLFHRAAQRQEATAELARSILRYLFRARHDQGLSFTP